MKLGIVTPLKCARAWKSIATRAEKDTWMEERKIRLHFTPPPPPPHPPPQENEGED